MAHLYRFHVPDGQDVIGEFELPPEESHHALRVARLGTGDSVELFTGDGQSWPAMVTRLSKKTVTVVPGEPTREERPARLASLCVGWPNHTNCVEDVIRRATELEAERIVFFKADYSERPPLMKDKYMRISIEAAKQCGSSWLPKIETVGDFGALLGAYEGRLLVADAGETCVPWNEAVQGSGNEVLVIGPEGGFSEGELHAASEVQALFVGLGPRILRTEVAAAVGLTLLQHHLGNL